jgi:tetratricopeptide (TPR) repeat protein
MICPLCGKSLSARPKPAPSAPTPIPEAAPPPPLPAAVPPPRSPLPYRTIAIAATAGVLFSAAVVTTLFLTNRRPPQPPETRPVQPVEGKPEGPERPPREESPKLAQLLSQGDAALSGKRYAEAEKAYAEALKLAPGDEAALKGLVDARTKAAVQAQVEEEHKKIEDSLKLERLRSRAEAALSGKRFAEAEKAYAEILELAPDDKAAQKGLIEARTGAAVQAAADEDQKKRQAEYDRLMADGRDALSGKRYADAVSAFSDAGKQKPGDEAARKALDEARAAQAAAEVEKKAQTDYQKVLDAGNNALIGMRYADAIREFGAALRLVPNDPAAIKGLRQAEARLDAIQDAEKRRAAFANLMDRARTAYTARRFDEALQTLDSALRLQPGDREASDLQRKAKQGQAEARADYDRAMQQANIAVQAGRYEEAVRFFNAALQAMPGDEAAQRGLRALDGLAQDVQAGQAAYIRFMNQGALAYNSGRFADAVYNYSEALRLAPGDAEALRWLSICQREADRVAERLLERERRFQKIDQLLKVADSALKARRFSDAVRSLNDVLALDRDNARALAMLPQARYGQALDAGHAAEVSRRYADAARAYEDALREQPGDPIASAALRRVKALIK